MAAMFWAQDKCYAWLWSLKITKSPASVPQGKRSESRKGKWKRPAEALLGSNLCLGTENVLEKAHGLNQPVHPQGEKPVRSGVQEHLTLDSCELQDQKQ